MQSFGFSHPEIQALEREKADLQRRFGKKPVLFAILAGVSFLLAVSFLRISLETLASPGDEALVRRVGTVMLVVTLLFLLAAVAFLVIFILKLTGRRKMSRRIREIDSEISRIRQNSYTMG